MDEKILGEYYSIIKNKISQGRFEAAMDTIDRLIYNFPNSAEGYYYKGVCNFALENYELSARCYINAIEFDITFAKAYFNLGVSLFMLNKKDEALINFGKALVLFTRLKDKIKRQRCIDALNYLKGASFE